MSKHFIGLQEQNNRSTIELMAAGRHLAALYLRSTTLSAGRNATTPWWVTPGTPAMILEFQWQGMPELPKGARQAIVPAISTTVHFQRVALKGQRINVWYLGSTISDPRDRELRELRILLLRFHAELESIKVVLRLIMEEKLQLKRGEKGSDEFQAYLHEAITLLSKLDRIGHSQRGLLEAVQGCFDEMNLGERASLLRKLQWIRGNLLHTLTQKAREFQYAGNNITIIEHMGDKYENSGMAANMGPDGQVHGNTFNQQVWNGLQGTTDLAKLAEDLVKLKAAMEGEARESEHRMAVGAVDAAQQAAREGNGPKVVEYLKMAGKWAYGIAEKIGVSVAAQVLKGTLGL